MSVRVLICDDHPVYRKGLGVLFGEVEEVVVVAEARDGEEAVRLADDTDPDVVIMDLHLPGMSGVDAIRMLLALHPEIGILVLTMFEDDTSLFAALRAGARGYLVKGADHEEIVRGVIAVARGEAMLGRAVSTRLAVAMGTPARSQAFPELTSREFEVLELMAAGMPNDQIAARLFLSPKTIRNNVSNILTKLGLETRAAAIARARDAGVGAKPSGGSSA